MTRAGSGSQNGPVPATHLLATPRLRLRPISDEHLEPCFALDQDPEVMRYINGGRATPRAEFLRESWPRLTARNGELPAFYAACEVTASGERFVGWFHLRPSVRLADTLEIGYRLARAGWGRGLATEGARALVRYALLGLDQPQVDACVHPDNTASRRVLERCGFEAQDRFMHPRGGVEVVHYLLRRDRADVRRGAEFGLELLDLDEQVQRHYAELHAIASAALRGRNGDRSLEPSEIVHDCYLRLARRAAATPERRTEFLALAATTVRSVLIDRARELDAQKRGGDHRRVTFHGDLFQVDHDVDVLALDEALRVLASLDERQARIVELKFFGRLTIEEIAEVLGCSARTVNHEWAHARAWLHRELSP